ncbi:MAG: serine/threonine-protein kinase [Myxococcota bacterium]
MPPATPPLTARTSVATRLRVGDYEIVDRVGVGGVAEVYRAVRRKAGQAPTVVILKRMRKETAADPFFSERFLAEADVVQMLRHPNVVGGLEVGNHGGVPHVVLDYVDGRDLAALISASCAAGSGLDLSTAIFVVTELLRGLHYVHTLKSPGGRDLRIVHRDVTPDNVLIGYDGTVALTDFGIALLDGIEAPPDEPRVAGKLAYLAPEQAAGAPLDHRADVFAAGCILYELTVGVSPFSPDPGESEEQVMERVREARFLRPSKMAPDYPRELEKVVLKALEKKPRSRFQDADDLRVELEGLMLAEPWARDELGTTMRTLFRREYEATRLPALE